MAVVTGTLVSSWAFAPWRHEAARTSAAWLSAHAAAPYDVVRADLSDAVPRARPVPPIDAAIRSSISLPYAAGLALGLAPPRDWVAMERYAEAAHRAVVGWRSRGAEWDLGYSGPIGLVDHLLLAVLRDQDVIPRWVAHLDDLPTHGGTGAMSREAVAPGGLLVAAERILAGAGLPVPESDRVADLVLTLIAARADEIVVGGEALAAALLATPAWAPHRSALTTRLRRWTPTADGTSVAGLTPLPRAGRARGTGSPPSDGLGESGRPVLAGIENAAGRAPGAGGEPNDGLGELASPAADFRIASTTSGATAGASARATAGAGVVRIAGWVPGTRAAAVVPLLTALSLLAPGERASIALHLASDAPAALAPLLRDLDLEEDVVVSDDFAGTPDFALVVDRPAPEGLGWSPRELSELAEWHELGVPIIVLAPQDSPLTQTAAEHHLPTEHVNAARALLARFAADV